MPHLCGNGIDKGPGHSGVMFTVGRAKVSLSMILGCGAGGYALSAQCM